MLLDSDDLDLVLQINFIVEKLHWETWNQLQVELLIMSHVIKFPKVSYYIPYQNSPHYKFSISTFDAHVFQRSIFIYEV